MQRTAPLALVQLTTAAHAQFFGVSGSGGGAGSWAARLPVECVRLRQQKSAYCTLPGEPFDQVKAISTLSHFTVRYAAVGFRLGLVGASLGEGRRRAGRCRTAQGSV